MEQTHSTALIYAYRQTHGRLLQLAGQLDDTQLKWRPSAQTPTLAFHFWHVARWADHLQAAIPGMLPGLAEKFGSGKDFWEAEKVAAAWGWPAEQLGFASTGMGMSDEVDAQLLFPSKTELLTYMEQAFAKAHAVIEQLDDALLLTPEQPQPMTEGVFGGGTIGDSLITHLTHDNRHLGMIEALLGILTGKGTVTV
jgi:uncharacterized damage-inducible protein DinB